MRDTVMTRQMVYAGWNMKLVVLQRINRKMRMLCKRVSNDDPTSSNIADARLAQRYYGVGNCPGVCF